MCSTCMLDGGLESADDVEDEYSDDTALKYSRQPVFVVAIRWVRRASTAETGVISTICTPLSRTGTCPVMTLTFDSVELSGYDMARLSTFPLFMWKTRILEDDDKVYNRFRVSSMTIRTV